MMYKTNDFKNPARRVGSGMTASARPTSRASRITDIIISATGLLVLSPLMLLITLGIMLEIGRPVFYTQIRTGQGGRKFRIFKFRKFHVSNNDPGPLLTVTNDTRMSRLGRVLEKTKLDELPQFLNVLLGDMSIVGPRPQNEIGSRCFTRETRALLDYRPGIFGPSQVAFRSEGALYPEGVDRHDFYRDRIYPVKARLDLAYYPNRTWLGDMTWMVRGVLAVVGLHPVLRELPECNVAHPPREPLEAMQDMLDGTAGTPGTV